MRSPNSKPPIANWPQNGKQAASSQTTNPKPKMEANEQDNEREGTPKENGALLALAYCLWFFPNSDSDQPLDSEIDGVSASNWTV